MRKILSILTIIILTSCSTENDCNNRFDFISTNDTIPILNLDIKKHSDSIRQEMCDLYGFDLCERCAWVEFKMPFKIENNDGYLKVLADFDSPYCEDCPCSIRLRHYYYILINRDNKLMAENRLITIDSLQGNIKKYLLKVGNDEMAPESLKRVNYRLIWDQESDQDFLDSVLTCIYKAHLSIIERKVNMTEINFCSLEKKGINELIEKYPLNIEFDLGKMDILMNLDLEKLKKVEDVENNPDSVLVNDMEEEI